MEKIDTNEFRRTLGQMQEAFKPGEDRRKGPEKYAQPQGRRACSAAIFERRAAALVSSVEEDRAAGGQA